MLVPAHGARHPLPQAYEAAFDVFGRRTRASCGAKWQDIVVRTGRNALPRWGRGGTYRGRSSRKAVAVGVGGVYVISGPAIVVSRVCVCVCVCESGREGIKFLVGWAMQALPWSAVGMVLYIARVPISCDGVGCSGHRYDCVVRIVTLTNAHEADCIAPL